MAYSNTPRVSQTGQSSRTRRLSRYLSDTKNLSVSGTLTVGGAVVFSSTLNTAGAVTFLSTLNTTGAVVFSNTLNTTGAVVFSNTLNTTGAVVFSNTLNTTGAVAFSNTLIITGNTTINSYLLFNPTTFTPGVIGMSGNTLYGFVFQGVGTESDWIVVSRSGFAVAAVYDNSDYFSIPVRLGIGLPFTTEPSYPLEVTGAVVFNNTLNTTGAVVFSNTLNTTGAVVFSNTLNTTGAVVFSNTLTVEGHLLANTTLNTIGAVKFGNTLNCVGNATFANVSATYPLIGGQTQIVTGSTTVNANASLVLCNCADNTTLTLPAAATNANREIIVKRIDADAYTLTVDGNASEKIDGADNTVIVAQYDAVYLRCDGSAWWIF